VLAASGDGERIGRRNPGEVYRQFVTCMLRKLDAALIGAERRDNPRPSRRPIARRTS